MIVQTKARTCLKTLNNNLTRDYLVAISWRELTSHILLNQSPRKSVRSTFIRFDSWLQAPIATPSMPSTSWKWNFPCLSIRPVGLSVGWSVCLPVFAKRGGKIHSHAPIRALLLYFALSSFNFGSIFIFDWDGHFSKKLSEDNCCGAKDNHVQEMTDLEEEIAGTYDQE